MKLKKTKNIFLQQLLFTLVILCFCFYPKISLSQSEEFDFLIPINDFILENSFSCLEVTPQTTILGPIFISNQAGVDNLRGVTKIIGDINFLHGSFRQFDISALSSLIEVDGSIRSVIFDTFTGVLSEAVSGNSHNITNESEGGLNCLQHVSGDLRLPVNISGNVYSELQSLISVGGKLDITFSDTSVRETELFGSLVSTGSFSIDLQSVTGITSDFLSSLIEIRDDLSVRLADVQGITPNFLSFLTSVDTLVLRLSSVDEDFSTNFLSSLEIVRSELSAFSSDLPAFPHLISLPALSISSMSITDSSFVALEYVADLDIGPLAVSRLIFDSNGRFTPVFQNISGLNTLTSVGSLRILNGTALQSITGFQNLRSVESFFVLRNLALPTNIDGFNALVSVGGDLIIDATTNIPRTTGISGFSSLELVAGNLVIEGFDDVLDITGFSSLGMVAGDLVIASNNELRNITGFSSLTSNNIIGLTLINNNRRLNCAAPVPNFGPILTNDPFEVSSGNLVNCE